MFEWCHITQKQAAVLRKAAYSRAQLKSMDKWTASALIDLATANGDRKFSATQLRILRDKLPRALSGTI